MRYTANGATLREWIYAYDVTGRITSITDRNGAQAYAYDARGRLTQVQHDDVVVSTYVYDLNGNRLAHNTETGTYDAQDRLEMYAGRSYSYDANGSLMSIGGLFNQTRFQYDAMGNLLNATLEDGTRIDYDIDARNRRIGKRVNGERTEGFLYQNQLQPIAWLNGNGTTKATFHYGDRGNVPSYMVLNGVNYRFVTDHLGSVRMVVNATTGAAVQELDYDEFGIITRNTNPGFQPFGFAGGLYDAHTELTRFGARDYDARTGRWTAKDPIRFAGGQANLYVYVGNDGVNWVDPSGLADVFTDMDNGTTTFDPRPEDADGEPFTIDTRNKVDSHSKPGANDPFSTPDVTVIPNRGEPKKYGPPGAYLNTGDPRGRNIHGGGSCSKDPTADEQGWCATYGCTRAQNKDLLEFNQKILDFQEEFPGVPIPYTRK